MLTLINFWIFELKLDSSSEQSDSNDESSQTDSRSNNENDKIDETTSVQSAKANNANGGKSVCFSLITWIFRFLNFVIGWIQSIIGNFWQKFGVTTRGSGKAVETLKKSNVRNKVDSFEKITQTRAAASGQKKPTSSHSITKIPEKPEFKLVEKEETKIVKSSRKIAIRLDSLRMSPDLIVHYQNGEASKKTEYDSSLCKYL